MEVCPFMATFDIAWLILVIFAKVCLKCLRMALDANEWQTLHNTCNGSE